MKIFLKKFWFVNVLDVHEIDMYLSIYCQLTFLQPNKHVNGSLLVLKSFTVVFHFLHQPALHQTP